MKRRTLLQSALTLPALSAAPWAAAQDANAIRILVGFAAGGGTDIIARTLADRLRIELNQPVIVDNRPGGSGRLAIQSLISSPPDGRTFMVAPQSVPVFHEILYSRQALGFDPLKDLAPVGTLVTSPFALVVSQSLGVKNAQEFLAWARANPNKASIGNGSPGGQGHFLAVQLAMATGVPFVHVPYKGHAPAIADLQGGQIAAIFLPAQDFVPLRSNPRAVVIGVADDQRSPLAADVATLKEQGLNVTGGQSWMGLWAAARAPRESVDRMSNALRKVLASPEYVDAMRSKYSQQPIFSTPEAMDKLLRTEIDLWRPVIKASGFTPT